MNRGGWFRRHSRNNAAADMPEGLWIKCPRCQDIGFAKDVERNLKVCTKCNYHHKLRAKERLELMVDEGSFEEMDAEVRALDPLGFPDYEDKITRARTNTGLTDAILTGYARIAEQSLIIGVADFAFMGGSMGSVVGEKIVRAMEKGAKERLPVVMITANGGGARMQEGLLSLMQMAKTSAASARLGQAGVPYIVVLTDPTMAGVYASYASLGDVILAEPGALIGFAGRRVGNQDLGGKLPDDFQTSEFQQRSGQIDQIVERKALKETLGTLLRFFAEGEEGVHAQQTA